MKRFLVSILQYDVRADSLHNFATIEKLFAVAGGRKSKFVVLPEMFASSFQYDELPEFSRHTIEILKFLQGIARKYEFYIIAGSLAVKVPAKLFNRSYLISAVRLSLLRQVHVFSNDENRYFSAGRKPCV